MAQRLRNSGQVLSQLACALVLHEAQKRISLFLHVLVRWFSPHVPQVSDCALQSWALCSQPLHLRHWRGSCFVFLALVLTPQISRPSLMMLLAVSADVSEITACAFVCPGRLLMTSLIQRAFWIEWSGRRLASLISLRCALLDGSNVIGTHRSKTLKLLSLKQAPIANL